MFQDIFDFSFKILLNLLMLYIFEELNILNFKIILIKSIFLATGNNTEHYVENGY